MCPKHIRVEGVRQVPPLRDPVVPCDLGTCNITPLYVGHLYPTFNVWISTVYDPFDLKMIGIDSGRVSLSLSLSLSPFVSTLILHVLSHFDRV